MSNYEKRDQVIDFDIRAIKEEDGEMVFEGYASVFDVVDSYNTKMKRGCFRKFLRTHEAGDVPLLVQHGRDSFRPVGVIRVLREDKHGLYMKAKFLSNDDGKRTYIAMKEGAYKQLSIGFGVPRGGATEDEKTGIIEFSELSLREISIVVMAANPEAKITNVRDVAERKRALDDALRAEGFSKVECMRITSIVSEQDLLPRRDAENYEADKDEQRDAEVDKEPSEEKTEDVRDNGLALYATAFKNIAKSNPKT